MIVVVSIGFCTGLIAVSGACALDRATYVTKTSIEISTPLEADRACIHLVYEKLSARTQPEAIALVWSCDLRK
jgi:hypothetical protein